MKVVLVNYRYGEGLADPDALLERYTTLTGWSTALLEAGAQAVSVVQGFSRDASMARDGVEYIFRAAGVNRAVARLRPDVAHVNGLDSPAKMARLRLALGPNTPIVAQDHASQVPTERGGPIESRARRTLRAAMMRSANAFLFTATELADPWRATGLIASRQRVYEVVESSTTMRPVERREARATSGVDGWPAVLWVGRLNSNKDPLTVLEGFEQSLDHLPDAMLTMVYSAEDLLHAVRTRVASSPRLAPRVRFAAHVDHGSMPAFYSAADIFVLGSHREGSGYALIEACACGAVPVVTSIPTFRVITRNGSIGALWSAGDARGLALALQRVGNGRMDAEHTRAREHFDRTLSWPVVGRNAVDAYRGVMTFLRTPN